MQRRLFTSGLKAVGSLSVLLALAACQPDDLSGSDAAERENIAPQATNLSHTASVAPQPDVVTVAPGANTIDSADLLANDGVDASTGAFSLVGNLSDRGSALTLSADTSTIDYTADAAWAWDSFEYEFCLVPADTSTCYTEQVQLVIEGGTNDCSPISLQETFRYSEYDEDRWGLGGGADPTAGPGADDDPEGEGWLRLTTLATQQGGYALFDEAFPSTQGVSMGFDVSTWGGSGADGIVFFLVDGDAVDKDNFEHGGWGGSLGYAPRNSEAGMPHAVLGVGFDEYGNFWNGGEGRTGPVGNTGATGQRANSIVIRGGAAEDWKHLADTNTLSDLKLSCNAGTCNERPSGFGQGQYRATVNILPAGTDKFEVVVYTQSADDAPIVERLRTTVEVAIPENLKLGFTGGTGGQTNYHEIRQVDVGTLTDLAMAVDVSPTTSTGAIVDGQEVTYTYTIENKTNDSICAAHVELDLPEGLTITDQSCASNQANNNNCGALGTSGENNVFVGLDSNETLTVTVTGTIAANGATEATANGRVTPRGGQGDLDPSDNFQSTNSGFVEDVKVQDHTLDIALDTNRTIDLLDGATDGTYPVDPTSVVIIDEQNLPAGVSVIVDANGVATVTAPAALASDFTFTYTVNDTEGLPSNVGTVSVVRSLPPQVQDVEVWVPADNGPEAVTIESFDPSEDFTISVNQTPADANATVQDKTVTVTPDTPNTAGTHVTTVEACNTVPAPANACTEIDVTVVYNDLPTINGGTIDVAAGSIGSLDLITSPGDIGAIDTTTLINPPDASIGTCAIDNGKATFTAAAGAGGQTAVCTVQVCEDKPANHCSDAAFTFGVVNVFTPTADTISTAQGDPVTVATSTLLSNDVNADASTFTLNAGTATGGTVAVAGGDVVFTPTAEATAGAFTYNVCAAYDANLCEDVTVTVDITAKPVGTPSTAWTLPEEPVTIDTPFDVSTNTTVDGTVTGGTVVIGPNGEITFTPDPGVVGEIQIPVTGCTIAVPVACESTTVTVMVNDLPTMDDDARVVAPGQSQSIAPSTDAGTVGQINSSSLSIDASASTQANGTCSIEAGNVNYVADADATVGQTDICVAEICEVQPAGACVTAEFSFQIDASFNPSDDNIATVENTDKEISIGTLLNNDGGADKDTFTVDGTPDTDGAYPTAAGGTLVSNGTDGYIYTPADDFVGDDTFQYNVCWSTDAADCSDVTVTIFVNDLPTLEGASRLVAPEQTVTVTPDVSEGEVGEIDWSSIQILPESTQSQGTCTIGDGPDYDITYTANAGADADETDICVVEVCEISPADACVTAHFEFTISAAFDPQPDELVTTQEVPVEFTKQDLLENDGGAVEESFSLVGTPDEDGVITTDNGGTVALDEDGTTYVYTPAEGFTGDDTFSYDVCSAFDEEDCEEVDVTVSVKQTPDAVDSTVWVVTGTPDVEVDLDDNYTGDSPIDSVTVTDIRPKDGDDNAPGTVTVNEGVITFVPNDPDAAVPYEIDVEICDEDDICTDVTVTVVYNDPPVAGPPEANIPEGRDGDFTFPFDRIVDGSNQGEVEGGWDEGSVQVSNDPSGPFTDGPVDLTGTQCAVIDGELVYTVDEGTQTLGTCYVQVCELEPGPAGVDATDRACAVIELTPVFTEFEDVVITGPADNSETDDKTPTVTGTSEPGTDVTITVDGEPVATVPVDEDGNWSWTPDEDLDEGPHTITATGESGVKDEITITITEEDPVVPSEDDVSITGPADNSSTDDKTPTITGTAEPGTEVTIEVDGEPVGTVTVGDDGKWSWTPDEDLEEGPHTIVAKGENGSEDQITLTITETDEKPVGEPDEEVAITGGRFLSCASTGTGAPAPATGLLALFVGLGLVIRRRKTARS